MKLSEKTELKIWLRRVKHVNRWVEMTVEAVSPSRVYMIQFARDVQMYGLWEALLYLANEIDDRVWKELMQTISGNQKEVVE